MRPSVKKKAESAVEIDSLHHERAEQSASRTRQLFDVRQTVDQLNLVGLTIEHDGTLSYVNPYTYRVTAWQPGDIIGKNFF